MFNKRYSLSGAEVVVVFAGLALLTALNFGAILLAGLDFDTTDAPPDPAPARPDMPREMQAQYDQWDRNANAISVFARSEKTFGWVFGYLDEDVARADAMAWCTRAGQTCRVMEMRDARGVVPGLAVPVTDKIAVGFERFASTPGPVALAVSGTGAFASGRGATSEQADAAALARCVQFAAKDRAAHLAAHPCRIIARR